jgi:hypothetical protein
MQYSELKRVTSTKGRLEQRRKLRCLLSRETVRELSVKIMSLYLGRVCKAYHKETLGAVYQIMFSTNSRSFSQFPLIL